MSPPKVIETARLQLTPPVLEDAEEIFASYARDPEVTRYLVWQPHESIEPTRDFVLRCMAVRALVHSWAITCSSAKGNSRGGIRSVSRCSNASRV